MMGQENNERRFWSLSNFFMVRNEKEFLKWIGEITEAYLSDLSIVVRKDNDLPAKLNSLADAINSMEERRYLLRPDDAVFYGLYIEGELPTVRMKSVKEINDEGDLDVEEPEVRDIDFLEELSTHLYEGEVALITTIGVEPATFISAKGFVVTSDGVTLSPVPLPASLFTAATDRSKFPVSKIADH